MTLILDSNDFEENKGIKFATKCIKSNNELHHFEWVNNQIYDGKDARSLVACIIDLPSITKVRLENCFRGDMNSYEILCPLFACDKKWDLIDFENNNIQTNGDTTIPNYIASNPSLEDLYLADNNLNDDDIILIANALKQNTNLNDLRLENNNITSIGKEALAKAVYDPTSLNSMSDCNHKCQIQLDGVFGKNLPSWCENSGSRDPKTTRSMKIYHLLSERNMEGSNVRHLNSEFEDEDEDSLKLVPYVLAAIQHYRVATQKTGGFDDFSIKPLSIMNEIVRGWKMPELYEKRS